MDLLDINICPSPLKYPDDYSRGSFDRTAKDFKPRHGIKENKFTVTTQSGASCLKGE